MTTLSAAAAHNEFAIDLAKVDKTYASAWRKKGVHALRDATMRVRRGEVFGLLGPNGAGKSTLVKILMTVISPTRCEGRVLGKPVGNRDALRRIGYLPEHHKFPDYLTGRQVLDFYGAMSKVPRADLLKRAPELLDLVGLGRWAGTSVRSYSKGMRQRLGIAQSLINDPELVLLDEPTDGVDPVGRRDIREILMEQKRRGKTVFLNSHLLSELEMVCDRVAIMVQGRVTAQGTLDELTAADRRYEIEVAGDGEIDARLGAALPEIKARGDAGAWGRLADGEPVGCAQGLVVVGTTEATKVQTIIDGARAAGLVIRGVRAVRPSLEDLFMKAVMDPITGRELGPGAADESPAPRGGRNNR